MDLPLKYIVCVSQLFYLNSFTRKSYISLVAKHRNTSSTIRDIIIIGVLTASMITLFAQMALEWHFTSVLFSSPSTSRSTTNLYLVLMFPPSSLESTTFAENVLEDITFLLADGLMVWRCFHTCYNRPMWQIMLPIGLFVIEVGEHKFNILIHRLYIHQLPRIISHYRFTFHIPGFNLLPTKLRNRTARSATKRIRLSFTNVSSGDEYNGNRLDVSPNIHSNISKPYLQTPVSAHHQHINPILLTVHHPYSHHCSCRFFVCPEI